MLNEETVRILVLKFLEREPYSLYVLAVLMTEQENIPRSEFLKTYNHYIQVVARVLEKLIKEGIAELSNEDVAEYRLRNV